MTGPTIHRADRFGASARGVRRVAGAAATIGRRWGLALGTAAVAICSALPAAWSHTFAPVHTVVVQVERCEVALLIGYTAGTGEPTERVLARAASQPKPHVLDALKDTLAAYALAPLTIAIDGVAVAPTSMRAKIGLGTEGARPTVVVLATIALPVSAHELTIRSSDPRTTRFSWQDRHSGRIDLPRAPAQDHWFTQAISFALPLRLPAERPGCPGALRRTGD